MKAKIVQIASGKEFTDGEVRVTLRFDEADSIYDTLRVRWSRFKMSDSPQLDQEFEFNMLVAIRAVPQ
jgi:hypothetical protein